MGLPENGFIVGFHALIELIFRKALRVRAVKIDHHGPLAVDAHSLGIGVHDPLGAPGGGDIIEIIGPVAAFCGGRPDAVISPAQRDLIDGHAAVAD